MPRVQNEAIHLRWSYSQARVLVFGLIANARQIFPSDLGGNRS